MDSMSFFVSGIIKTVAVRPAARIASTTNGGEIFNVWGSRFGGVQQV